MFTVKIYWNSKDLPLYSVHSATKYTLSHDEGNTHLHLYRPNGNIDDEVIILLGLGTMTYVMNDRGATVDTIQC